MAIFWCYGGGVNPNISSLDKYNDLWCFNPVALKWSLINGSNIPNVPAIYGTIGIPDPGNQPGARCGSVGWVNAIGDLYLFGGNPLGPRNDLWKYVIDTACLASSIQENNFTNELLVFPNPTNSSFTISFSSSEKQTIELRAYNTLGKQIYFLKEEITSGKFEKEINVGKWSDGIYFVQVKMKNSIMSKKVVIER